MTPARFHEIVDQLVFLLFGKPRDPDQQPPPMAARSVQIADAPDSGGPSWRSSYIWDREIDGPDDVIEIADDRPVPSGRPRPEYLVLLLVPIFALFGYVEVHGRLPRLRDFSQEWLILVITWGMCTIITVRGKNVAKALEQFNQNNSRGGPQRPAAA